MRRLIAATATGLLVTVAAACTSDEPAPDPQQTDGSGDTNGETDEGDPTGASGTIELAGNQQTSPRHGTTVAVNAITVDEQGDIFLDVEALVAGSRGIRLALSETVLLDDLGNRYEWAVPDANSSLQFAQDSAVELVLAFVGPIDPAATRVTLGINADYGGELQTVEDGETSNVPSYTFADLPLPGVGLDDEAAGEDDTAGIRDDTATTEVTGVAHEGPVGVTVEITGIEATTSTVLVSAEVANTSSDWRRLLTRAPVLRATQGGQVLDRHRFEFQAIRNDDGEFDDLRLEGGDEASVVFAFRGNIPADADGLRLGITASPSEVTRGQLDADEQRGRGPKVIFDLPVPDGSAALADDAEDDT